MNFKPEENPKDFRIPNGETLGEVQSRMIIFTENIFKKFNYLNKVVVVSHNLAISSMLCYYLHKDLKEFSDFTIDSGSINTLEYYNEKVKVVELNYIKHLNKMIKKIIREKIYNIFNKTFEGVSIDISDVDIVDSKKVEHGDYATNISMKYAKKLNMNPLQIAEKISNQLKSDTETFFDDVVYIKPGFINFKINSLIFNRILKDIYKNRERYGSGIKKMINL